MDRDWRGDQMPFYEVVRGRTLRGELRFAICPIFSTYKCFGDERSVQFAIVEKGFVTKYWAIYLLQLIKIVVLDEKVWNRLYHYPKKRSLDKRFTLSQEEYWVSKKFCKPLWCDGVLLDRIIYYPKSIPYRTLWKGPLESCYEWFHFVKHAKLF